MLDRKQLLASPVEHLDITRHDVRGLIDQMSETAFSARDLARAANIYNTMLADRDCSVILCLAGSLVSAGLKHLLVDLIDNRMVDAIVSTGANIVDQDFFEGLGFRHYIADESLKSGTHDDELRELSIDRIYDTLIDENNLRVCDDTIMEIADALEPGIYSSRQFIREMGRHLDEHMPAGVRSIVHSAYKNGVPIFCPAFSDCSAGFGLVAHQAKRPVNRQVAIDSVRDFHELTRIKIMSGESGLLMIGGGVPKNFAQDIVVAAEILEGDASMHKYAVQITVADSRDGALSGSTLKEACSWGKVDLAMEQMVYSEATLALPLIAGDAYHRRHWEKREAKRFADRLDEALTAVG
ncbi:MAG: deoxyhypusine synthase [Phycisphaeraceae bacterium]|nr:deoxyhypusine synthase [Phycisphaeraceae bacterium]MCB9847492.1 deoxyhypusine synthase [Phycisphaeraceae bacterium]